MVSVLEAMAPFMVVTSATSWLSSLTEEYTVMTFLPAVYVPTNFSGVKAALEVYCTAEPLPVTVTDVPLKSAV